MENDKISLLLVVFLIICSLFMPLSINQRAQENIFSSERLTRYVSLSRLEMISKDEMIILDKADPGFKYSYNLGIKEGIINGAVILGNTARNTVVGTLIDYKNGFYYKSSQMKVVWLFFGIVIEFAKNAVFSVLEMLLVGFILLTQSMGSYLYILAYVLTVLLVIGIFKVLRD